MLACKTLEGDVERALHKGYEIFLKEMKGRLRLEKARVVISETDMDYIRTFAVKRGTSGKVMELFCPASKAVAIRGQSQARPQESPYFFTLRCFDESGKEPSPSTKMNFKAGIENGGSPLWKASYGSLKRYHFPEGIFLSNGNRLELEVIDPNIDIDRVEVSMELDVFSPV